MVSPSGQVENVYSFTLTYCLVRKNTSGYDVFGWLLLDYNRKFRLHHFWVVEPAHEYKISDSCRLHKNHSGVSRVPCVLLPVSFNA